MPKYQSLSSSKQTLKDAKASLQNLQGDKSTLSNLEAKLKSSSTDVTLLDEALPLDTRTSRIYIMVDSLVKASGMTLANIGVEIPTNAIAAGDTKLLADPLASPRKLESIPINVSITGTMDQFVNFLKQLEASSRIIDVEAIEVGAGQGPLLNFRLKLKTYSYAPNGN
jgi:Tfp pilus assembly protein PilO